VPYKASTFDVVHDAGRSTAFLYGKASLKIFVRSWARTGRPDTTGEDNGTNKIDYISLQTGNSPALVDQLVARIQTNGLWDYTFVHFTEPDGTGHSAAGGVGGVQQYGAANGCAGGSHPRCTADQCGGG